MRISDWSSDVCSSDLRRGGFGSCGPRARIGIQKCPAGIDDAGCAGADPARMESRNRSRSHHRGRHMTDQFQLTDDQLAIQDMARKFTADRITPFAAEWDEKHNYPVDVWKAAGEVGFGAIYVAEEP